MVKRKWSKNDKKYLQDVIRSMKNDGYTTGEIANRLNISEADVVSLDRESNDRLMSRMRY